MSVAEELKDRFIGMYFFVMEGMEFRPGFILTDEEYAVAHQFDALHDSVDAIPDHVCIAAEALVAKTEPLVFERHLQAAIGAVGRPGYSKNATEFLQSLNYVLALDHVDLA